MIDQINFYLEYAKQIECEEPTLPLFNGTNSLWARMMKVDI